MVNVTMRRRSGFGGTALQSQKQAMVSLIGGRTLPMGTKMSKSGTAAGQKRAKKHPPSAFDDAACHPKAQRSAPLALVWMREEPTDGAALIRS